MILIERVMLSFPLRYGLQSFLTPRAHTIKIFPKNFPLLVKSQTVKLYGKKFVCVTLAYFCAIENSRVNKIYFVSYLENPGVLGR